MSKLITEPNFADGDGVYARVLASCEELSDDETNRFFARLALVLANHVGDERILSEAIKLARMAPES